MHHDVDPRLRVDLQALANGREAGGDRVALAALPTLAERADPT